jgi:hypothetical protein
MIPGLLQYAKMKDNRTNKHFSILPLCFLLLEGSFSEEVTNVVSDFFGEMPKWLHLIR